MDNELSKINVTKNKTRHQPEKKALLVFHKRNHHWSYITSYVRIHSTNNPDCQRDNTDQTSNHADLHCSTTTTTMDVATANLHDISTHACRFASHCIHHATASNLHPPMPPPQPPHICIASPPTNVDLHRNTTTTMPYQTSTHAANHLDRNI